MNHPIYRVTSFDLVAAYTLRVHFDDGTVKTIDFEPVLAGELYAPLRDEMLFNRVKADVVATREQAAQLSRCASQASPTLPPNALRCPDYPFGWQNP